MINSVVLVSKCTAKSISYRYTYTHYFFFFKDSFPIHSTEWHSLCYTICDEYC